ncbi:MAG: hypothetical protein EZS28_036243, partial [Streblomastix strix]
MNNPISRCPYCGQTVSKTEGFCPSCGHSYIITPPVTPVQPKFIKTNTLLDVNKFINSPTKKRDNVVPQEEKDKARRSSLKALAWVFGIEILVVLIISLVTGLFFQIFDFSSPTDFINSYQIDTVINKDGSMENTYSIEWEFLKDLTNEPLYFGVPNSSCSIVSLGDNISQGTIVDRYNSESGSWIKLSLKKKTYSKNEKIHLGYVLRQNHMLCYDDEKEDYFYQFVPGWFDKIKVESYLFRWSSTLPMTKTNGTRIDEFSCFWSGSLKPGKYADLRVEYARMILQIHVPPPNIEKGLVFTIGIIDGIPGLVIMKVIVTIVTVAVVPPAEVVLVLVLAPVLEAVGLDAVLKISIGQRQTPNLSMKIFQLILKKRNQKVKRRCSLLTQNNKQTWKTQSIAVRIADSQYRGWKA